jgi:hypothetical protein
MPPLLDGGSPGELGVELPLLILDLRPGSDGRACDIELSKPLILILEPVDVFSTGRTLPRTGERQCSVQVFMSKKSRGYSSLVCLLMKHLPSSGSSA